MERPCRIKFRVWRQTHRPTIRLHYLAPEQAPGFPSELNSGLEVQYTEYGAGVKDPVKCSFLQQWSSACSQDLQCRPREKSLVEDAPSIRCSQSGRSSPPSLQYPLRTYDEACLHSTMLAEYSMPAEAYANRKSPPMVTAKSNRAIQSARQQ